MCLDCSISDKFKHNKISELNELIVSRPDIINVVAGYAVQFNHVKYALKLIKKIGYKNFNLGQVAYSGNLKLAKYLYNRECQIYFDTFIMTAVNNGHLNLIKWAFNKQPNISKSRYVIGNALHRGYIEIADWLYNNNFPIDFIYLSIIFRDNRINSLQWLLDKNVDINIDTSIIEHVIHNKHIDIIKFIHTKSIDIPHTCLISAISYNCFDIVKFLYEEVNLRLLEPINLDNVIITMSIELLEYIFDNGIPINVGVNGLYGVMYRSDYKRVSSLLIEKFNIQFPEKLKLSSIIDENTPYEDIQFLLDNKICYIDDLTLQLFYYNVNPYVVMVIENAINNAQKMHIVYQFILKYLVYSPTSKYIQRVVSSF